METLPLSEGDLRQEFIRMVESLSEATDQQTIIALRNDLTATIKLAFLYPVYERFRIELLNAGYVYVERRPYSLNFFKDFDRARFDRNTQDLWELLRIDEDLYRRALQERVLSVVKAIIDKVRGEDGTDMEELVLLRAFKRVLEWIPGIERFLSKDNLIAIAKEKDAARNIRSVPISSLVISASMEVIERNEELSICNLTIESISTLSPLAIFRFLRELYDSYAMIPNELVSFCETGFFTTGDIRFARSYLQGNLANLQDLVRETRSEFLIVANP